MPTKRISKSSPKRKLPLQCFISITTSSKKRKSAETLRKEKKAVKIARNVVLDHIVQSIFNTRKEHDGKTPHKFVQNIVESHRTLCPWITRHVINERIAARIDLIVSSKGQKYELNRSNWTTYQNVSQMYECIEEELITTGVAVRLPEPIWMDADGNHVEEDDLFGCKVTCDITKPDICVVADEVGRNTSQKDDGNMGGERWLTEPGTIPQRKI